MALARARPVNCHERKLAKYVKRVREKKIKRGKERAFHRLSPSIISTLAFQPCTTLSSITRSIRNEKYKGGRRTTNQNYPTLQHGEETTKTILKTTQKLLSLGSGKPQGIYRQTGISGYIYGAARQILARGSTRKQWKRGHRVTVCATPPAAQSSLVPLSAGCLGF